MLAKTNLNTIRVLIYKALIGSYISYNEFVLVNNALKEYDDTKEKIEKIRASKVHQRLNSIFKTMLSYCLNCKKNTETKNPEVVKTIKGKAMVLLKCTVFDSKKIQDLSKRKKQKGC